MALIGFLARKHHGKNTAGDYLVKNYNFTEMAFATQLKEGIKAIYGLSDDQLYGDKKETIDKFWNVTPRTLMQWLGTDVFRKKDKDFWVKTLERKYLNFVGEKQRSYPMEGLQSKPTYLNFVGEKQRSYPMEGLQSKPTYLNFVGEKQRQNTNKTEINRANVVITDVRFQNEVDFIHKYNGIVIKIHRESINDTSTHIAEKGIDNIEDYDFLISNDGTIKDLHNNIQKIIISLDKRK
uniref:Deoxynucleoside monophosphate kinase n=1 Tax=Mimivirus LCMiAC02 TaxID=2506609 RepID=A0A481Z0J9_9VIRU|nr:MAG: uncharacterized protein LCMiAC02_01260 [Mimivirus LCMiAC02]